MLHLDYQQDKIRVICFVVLPKAYARIKVVFQS
jgi:hypothetical protein